ncbi:hypothetical protein JMF89_10415 [Clostridiaceae bacterium UIB06]|uniref:Uncharacterized protein n=1 Tax=Clostridium thailandense TaxID=2794346 RepID=A0A949U044_9CLOT|nr:hypothetical protein [Clostridium thailandense]MBV7274870.1 hypothetical protein [Clostridium thailandense]MCH5137615.1 hypothetical protein [Clostridiaceae bacterium UIB06]
MKISKKPLAILSTIATSGIIAAALSTPVSAKPTTIVVTDTDSKIYEYSYDDLKTSAAAAVLGDTTGAKLYNDFISRKSSIKAFYDDTQKSYIDFSVVASAAADAAANGTTFDFKSFTETAATESLTTNKVSVDTSGNITTTAGGTATGGSTNTTPSGNSENDLKTKLDSLVTAGTITEDQEASIIALDLFTPPTNTTGGSTSDTPPSGTSENSAKTKLDTLVTAGTITEAQETAVLDALKPSDNGNPNGGSTSGTSTTTGTATYSQSGNTVTQSNQNITASGTDQSAVKVTDSGTYTLSDSTITTSGDTSSMDDSSFYGLNAAVLAESGSKITLSNTTINTSGAGANGVFACGEGSIVNLSNIKINCTATGSHGVDATKAGVLNLNNVDIVTSGDGASGAIATDRGGGTINVTGGVVTTNGTKSPGIYSTGDITVSNGTFTTNKSEAVTIEGENSVKATDCTFTSKKNYGVFIYQSFSGDAEVGSGTFTMEGGSITANEGPMFYSTNTTAVINLKDATLNTSSGILLKAGADQWGTTGSNGSNVTLNADSQNLTGNVELDNISTASLSLKNNSSLKSTINSANTAKSITVSLDSASTWNVTGNSYITSLTDADTTLANINDNGFTIYYDSNNSNNNWLNGKTYTLKDAGKLTPMSTSN